MLLGSKEDLSLNHFAFEFDVSRNTILNDLKVEEVLEDFKKIKYSRKSGYLLNGNEFNIRKLLFKVINQVLLVEKEEKRLKKILDIKDEQLKDFTRRINNVENKLNLKFTDEKMVVLPYALIILLRRIENGFVNDICQ